VHRCASYERLQLVTALYAAGLSEPAQKKPLLDEAQKFYATLCDECRGIKSVAWVGQLLAQAR
jgi:hypothetical protein